MSTRPVDMVGQTYGRLTIISNEPPKGAERQVRARCECGSEKVVNARAVRRGSVTSCRCAQREANTKHGASSHPLYSIWNSMRSRCTNPNVDMYPVYGGRGIAVCPEWLADPWAFIRWAEPRFSPGLQIDRIDNDGGYSPQNCRFVSCVVNERNRSNNRVVVWRGQSMCVTELAERSGVNADALRQRIKKLGWSVDRAAETPVYHAAARSP